MQDQPDIDNLLATARESILQEILPVLPEDQRLEALMAANALVIARRAVAAGEAPLQAELKRLVAIYGLDEPSAMTGDVLIKTVDGLNRRLARDIRDGVFDAPGVKRRAVQDALRQTTIDKLRESNPKMLKAEGIE